MYNMIVKVRWCVLLAFWLPGTLYAQSPKEAWPGLATQKASCSTCNEPSPFADSRVALRVWGVTRDLPNFDFGETDTHSALYERFRATLDYKKGKLHLNAEADFLAGRLAGKRWPDSPELTKTRTRPRGLVADDQWDNIMTPRSLFAAYKTPIGLVRAGLQTSHWGLGLLANDGGHDRERLFGQSYGGDSSWRAIFATTPFASMGGVGEHVFVALGGDIVWRDDLASFVDGDRTYQGVLSLFYRKQDAFMGAYMVYRAQEDRDNSTLDVFGLDVTMSNSWEFMRGAWQLELGMEAAWLGGSTTRALPEQQPEDTSLGVQALGLALEGRLRHVATDASLKLLAGYASGEADTQDDTLYRFRFDPNYKVGLILFDSYIPAMTRTYYRQASDEARSGRAKKGLENLISDGGIENAMYVNPQLLFGSEDGLLAGIGVLVAYAAEAPAAPLQTLENGGQPTGVRGATPVSRDLGVEVDIGTQYRFALVSDLYLELKGEFGILFPGKAFDNAQGQTAAPQNMIRGRVALSW